MANERLRAAIAQAGITTTQLALQLDVDTKTVQRWIAGRTPYPRHRSLISQTLGMPEHELWPEAATAPAPERHGEIIATHPAGLQDLNPDWTGLIEQATERIDLLDYSLHHLLKTPGIVQLLARKAREGVRIRILIGDLDDTTIVQDQELVYGRDPLDPRAAEYRPFLVDQLEWALRQLKPLTDTAGIHIRSHQTQRFNSIHRVDDQMLLILHTTETPTPRAPLLHLQRQEEGGLFHLFAEHFERIWTHSADRVDPDLIDNPRHRDR